MTCNQETPEPPVDALACYFALALALALTAAQRLCCASAILLRASALKTRFFLALVFTLALAGAFFAVRPALGAMVPSVASTARARCKLAISASIWVRIFSIAIN